MMFFNFNVIARPAEDVAHRIPDPEGRALWTMFHRELMGRLFLIVDEADKAEHLETWLVREGFKAFQYEILETKDPVIKAERVHQLSASLGRTNWYVDNDPRTCARTLEKGIPTLMVANPYIIRPEWVAPRDIQPWGELVAEIERQDELRNRRTWGEMEEPSS